MEKSIEDRVIWVDYERPRHATVTRFELRREDLQSIFPSDLVLVSESQVHFVSISAFSLRFSTSTAGWLFLVTLLMRGFLASFHLDCNGVYLDSSRPACFTTETRPSIVAHILTRVSIRASINIEIIHSPPGFLGPGASRGTPIHKFRTMIGIISHSSAIIVPEH